VNSLLLFFIFITFLLLTLLFLGKPAAS
jgi:hypothetical protein